LQRLGIAKSQEQSMFRKFAIAICVSAGALGASLANASVILIGPGSVQPAGIGTVLTLLSLQSQGNATDETGRVSYNGSTSVATSLPNPTGAAQPGVDTTVITGGANNQTRSFAELGLTQASDLRVMFNINEPTGAADVLLRSLIFTAYNASGASVFSASLASPVNLTQIQGGIGLAGYLFGLDNADAAVLQALFAPDLRLGIQASVSNAQGGFDTFFATTVAAQTPGEGPTVKVPEPGTVALLGFALGGLAFVRRRRTS
jgi:hypothetical protein